MQGKSLICDGYILGSEIYKTNFSHICLAYKDNKTFAFKYIKKNEVSNSQKVDNFVNKEIEITKYLQNSSVVKLVDFKINSKIIFPENESIEVDYLVFEYINGRDLLEYINYTGRFQEKDARYLIFKLIKILQIIHLKGYVHRDIKPHNMLIDDYFNLILIDFGSASKINDSSELIFHKENMGTIGYIAPEVYGNANYDKTKIDIFSLGVLLFNMTTGKTPFKIANQNDENFKKIMNKNYLEFWNSFEEPKISLELKDLIYHMICADPIKRYSITEILNHYWMKIPSSSYEEISTQFKERLLKIPPRNLNTP